MSRPPDAYLDGCTFAPDRFGAVYHGDICTDHDLDYWQKRRFIDKWAADARWAYRITERHWRNGWWALAGLALAAGGWLALSTFGWWFWLRRHRWDNGAH